MAQEIAAMRQELARLRAEVDALKQALGTKAAEPGTPGAPAAPGAAQAQAVPADTAATVSMLQTQVQELAQVKVESDSRLPIKVFGTILSNTFYNSDEANWLENPNIVNRFGGITGRPGSFSSTLRQSRIGLAVNGPEVGGAKASGRLIVDFFGGTPAFNTGQVMGLPRLLYAFARLDGEKTALEVGQDHMMLAPRDPTSLAALSFPDLFRSGNLYLRVPQARVERKLGGGLTVMGGIVAPIAGDFNEDFYLFVPPAGAGERSKMPAVQASPRIQVGRRRDAPVRDWLLGPLRTGACRHGEREELGGRASTSTRRADASAPPASSSTARTSISSAGRSIRPRSRRAAGRKRASR